MEPIKRISQVKVGHGTHAGMTGKENEDSYGFFAWTDDQGRSLHLGVVADGIGGQTAGELASSMAVQAVKEYFDRQHSVDNMSRHLERAIMTANMAVYEHSQANPQFSGMGSTMVLVAFVEDKLFTAHVGDSRIYRLRDGTLQQLSVDHTWAQEAIEAGFLTREQAKTHPNRNVIKRYLGGTPDVEVDHRLVLDSSQPSAQTARNQGTKLQKGDLLLLCSDGLTDMITDAAVFASLTTHQQLQPAVDELIQKANEAGGKDNITVVTMQVPGGKAVAAPPPKRAAPAGPSRGLRLGVPLILGALALIFLVGIVGAGAYVFFGRTNSADSVIEATEQPTEPPAATATTFVELPVDNPATAAILLTAQSSGEDNELLNELLETPGLIPTLRAQLTNTPTPLPTQTASSTPVATPTTDSSSGSGGSSGSSGGGSSATSTPRPTTNTPQPSSTPPPVPTNTPKPSRTNTATNTPVPPTNTATNTPVPPTNTATNTPVPPTNTATNTPVPPTNTATNTPVPPTNTATNTPEPPPPSNTPPSSTNQLAPPSTNMLSAQGRLAATGDIEVQPLLTGFLGWLMILIVLGGGYLMANRRAS